MSTCSSASSFKGVSHWRISNKTYPLTSPDVCILIARKPVNPAPTSDRSMTSNKTFYKHAKNKTSDNKGNVIFVHLSWWSLWSDGGTWRCHRFTEVRYVLLTKSSFPPVQAFLYFLNVCPSFSPNSLCRGLCGDKVYLVTHKARLLILWL